MAEVLNQEQVLVNEDTLTVMADFIRLKLGEETNPNAAGFTKYTPMELAIKIGDEMPFAKDAIPYYAKQFSGDCSKLFMAGKWDWFIETCGEDIYTEYLTNCESMFEGSKVKELPFTLNFANNGDALYMCRLCENLETLPNMTGKITRLHNSFDRCYKIRELPEQWIEGIDWVNFNNAPRGSLSGLFYDCVSLRVVPKNLLKKMYSATNNSYNYGSIFHDCYSLDEIIGFRGPNNTLTDNCLSNFYSCSRVKRIVFDYEDEATYTPRTQNWKNQSIALDYYVGFANTSVKKYILNYNSGITADKEVTDDATYQALKNDPDWFTCKVEYSRYNHDSAVETINSLPDTSAYLAANGGTNTIKFKGAAGSATDGGAINTLTEAEIAVAAAKGWTVSLV